MAGSPYTLEAAREILLGKRSPAVDALDKLLGAAILAVGPVGLATGQPWLLAAWGWIDQKNELVARLDDLVTKGRGRLRGATGGQRHELLAATHAALVVGSFFAALREVTGPAYDEMALTDAEVQRLAGAPTGQVFDAVAALLQVRIELPWAGKGFERTVETEIRPYYFSLARRCLLFFSGLEAWRRRFGGDEEEQRPLRARIVDRAVARYRAEYLALATEIPEFRIWTLFGEHLAEQNALARLEDLVGTLVTAEAAPEAAIRTSIARINRAVLRDNIVDLDETADVTAVRVPSVEDGYVEPRFKWAVMQAGSRPAEERWWSDQQEGTDLAGFLAAHFASPGAAERPLVVLGHPGAGKSLFSKVCAARLSATDAFVTVRVPLRDVPDPSVSIYRQIEEVLRESTHGKVEWPALCAASRQLVRVVVIDGLDELMQATGATESRYLRNVMEFQRTESATTGPVAVVVTSRTVVADLAAIPPGCLVVKLEEFSDAQIDTWVSRWTAANTAAVASGQVRAIKAATLRGYGALARQPLLLLLLAIVAADRDLPPPESSADLYRILLDDFVRRELARPDRDADHLDADERKIAELWKLGLVAFGMLNRGQQHLREADLAADLAALPAPVPPPAERGRDVGRTLDPARRVVGRFFFVHAAEAAAGAGGRSYEFLHATFGDYLIAHHTAALLRDAANTRRHRTAFQSWDDDLLFVLLSHTLLVAYGSRAVTFFTELVAGDEEIAGLLEHLVVTAHDRWGKGRFGDYDPSARTAVWRTAAYTANLVALRLAVPTAPVPIARLCPRGAEAATWWPSQVRLWSAVLPETQWGPLMSGMRVTEDRCLSWDRVVGPYEVMAEELALDPVRAMHLAAGRVLMTKSDDFVFTTMDGPWLASLLADQLRRLAPTDNVLAGLPSPGNDSPGLLWLRMSVLARHGLDMDVEDLRRVLDACARAGVEVEQEIQATLFIRYPEVRQNLRFSLSRRITEMIIGLADLLRVPDDRLVPVVADGVADTPEGRAVRAMPPELARRLIPELAVSLVRRMEREDGDS